MASASPPEVVVVGAGVIGLAIAWEAAKAGLSVTLVDPEPGRGAGWAAAGMLAPVGEAHFGEDRLTSLNLAAAEAWPAFAADLEEASGEPLQYTRDGSLLVAADPSDSAAVGELVDYQRALGLPVERLSAAECRRSEPLLSPAIRAGARLLVDGQVDNRKVLAALLDASGTSGVTLVQDQVASVDIAGDSVAGVTLVEDGPRPIGSVVIAAGCRSGQIRDIPDHLLPPVRPVKGLTLRLRARAGTPRLTTTVRGLVHGRSCYLVARRDGTVVVGATVEEKGFDTTVQAGAVADLLEDALRLVPSLEEYELVDTAVGLRPGSPDNAPIVGATEVAGLVVATGHYRNGFLLAPLTAHEVVGILTARQHSPGAFSEFGPDRFTGTAADHRRVGTGRNDLSQTGA
jgi:glycine oxidase